MKSVLKIHFAWLVGLKGIISEAGATTNCRSKQIKVKVPTPRFFFLQKSLFIPAVSKMCVIAKALKTRFVYPLGGQRKPLCSQINIPPVLFYSIFTNAASHTSNSNEVGMLRGGVPLAALMMKFTDREKQHDASQKNQKLAGDPEHNWKEKKNT